MRLGWRGRRLPAWHQAFHLKTERYHDGLGLTPGVAVDKHSAFIADANGHGRMFIIMGRASARPTGARFLRNRADHIECIEHRNDWFTHHAPPFSAGRLALLISPRRSTGSIRTLRPNRTTGNLP